MSDLLQRLIVHVADFVHEEGGDLTKTKLVKLLYLIDLIFYRRFRSTLTQVRWFYHLYGPYSYERTPILEISLIFRKYRQR